MESHRRSRRLEFEALDEASRPRRVAVLRLLPLLLVCLTSRSDSAPLDSGGRPPVDLSPAALAVGPDGTRMFIACATAGKVLVLDLPAGATRGEIEVPGSPQALVLDRRGERLYVACAAAASSVCVVDTATLTTVATFAAGHTATALALSPDDRLLFVCNRFSNDVSVLDAASGEVRGRVPVLREPIAAAVSPGGGHLVVANHLHNQRADNEETGACVTVIATTTLEVVKHIPLPRGCGMLRGLAFSPDGRYVVVTHLLARYYLPPTHVDFGRINSNGLSVIDLRRLAWRNLLLLDTSGRGVGNPWGIAWTPDGSTIVVTHAGTHEVSLVDAPALLERRTSPTRRVALEGRGPRALALTGSRVLVANYFSDTLSTFDLADPELTADTLPLKSTDAAVGDAASLVRRGEAYFNDATLCFQGWQSCASCHDTDARMDALNWDLLNDGTGNPKNAKSLLWAHRTPPAMALGVRANAETAVRAGIRHILFTTQPESVAAAIDAYLRSLEPMPSPCLQAGQLSPSAERGQRLFMDPEVGCQRCHPPPRYTDLRAHDVRTRSPKDKPEDRFDTPTLVELWRTAPYLHDGSVATLSELFASPRVTDQMGASRHLTPEQRDDLVAYLLSL